MNYQFENVYTKAESIKWQVQAASELNCNSVSFTSAYLVFVIQFVLWVPVLYFLSSQDIPFIWMALLLFISFIAIGMFYDSMILPYVAARFNKKPLASEDEASRAIITINEEEIRTREGNQEITFKWTGIRSIMDNEKTVFLFTETGYCLIPARCFAGFLEKDAFVRACHEKISGRTEQGAVFT